MPPTAIDYEAALQEIEEDTMPPGMTQAQYAEAREMMENLGDVEFYEAMTEREYEQFKTEFLAANQNRIMEEFRDLSVDKWHYIGCVFDFLFMQHAVAQLRDKYRTSGELLECVREAVMGVEA